MAEPKPVVSDPRADCDALVLLWSKTVGAIRPTVQTQLKLLLREWTREELERAIRLVAASGLKPTRGEALSRRHARAFYKILREWRQAKPK